MWSVWYEDELCCFCVTEELAKEMQACIMFDQGKSEKAVIIEPPEEKLNE